MDTAYAQRIIECLRMGIPPEDGVQYLTVGRDAEINQLKVRLVGDTSGAL